VAVQFDGYGQSIGWLALGLASIEIGRRLVLKPADIFGLVVGGLALGRVALIDWHLPALDVRLWDAGDLHLTRWAILALVAIAVTHVAAWRVAARWPTLPVWLAVIGTVGWMVASASQTRGFLTTGFWLFAAAALLAASGRGLRQRYLEISLAALAA